MSPVQNIATHLTQEPHGALLYSTSPLAFARLRAVQDLHGVGSIEAMPNTALLTAGGDLLAAVLSQWRDSLESDTVAQIRKQKKELAQIKTILRGRALGVEK